MLFSIFFRNSCVRLKALVKRWKNMHIDQIVYYLEFSMALTKLIFLKGMKEKKNLLQKNKNTIFNRFFLKYWRPIYYYELVIIMESLISNGYWKTMKYGFIYYLKLAIIVLFDVFVYFRKKLMLVKSKKKKWKFDWWNKSKDKRQHHTLLGEMFSNFRYKHDLLNETSARYFFSFYFFLSNLSFNWIFLPKYFTSFISHHFLLSRTKFVNKL